MENQEPSFEYFVGAIVIISLFLFSFIGGVYAFFKMIGG
jgi:hypothetical protein